MTGPEHYRAAEGLAETAAGVMNYEHGFYSGMSTQERLQRWMALNAEAQVHATLALAAATGLSKESYDFRGWMDTANVGAPIDGGQS